MRNRSSWWIVILILLAIDFYVFNAIRFLTQNNNVRFRTILFTGYWVLSAAAVVFVLMFPSSSFLEKHVVFRNYVFAIIVGLFFAKLIAAVFFLFDDIRRLFVWLMAKIFPKSGVDFTHESNHISRSNFLTWLGLILGTGLFGTLLYGFSNKYNYKVRKIKLSFNNLPKAFKGLKIVQVSDIHSGSFTDKSAVEKGVELALKQKADLILFTGDLVNDKADEMHDYMDVFSKLKAPMGVYSTLGNHDYGDYTSWPSAEAKSENLERLKKIHGEMGWKLMMNEHVPLEKKW